METTYQGSVYLTTDARIYAGWETGLSPEWIDRDIRPILSPREIQQIRTREKTLEENTK